MANEAFALSPMSARAAEPNEQDYDAIREAFMETARGRWFLGEYAKRNRNADTRMVLDAVAKIEETLAAQRQPLVEDRLPEALVEIRSAIREAEAIAIAAFDPAAIEASLAPIPRGVRIIKEISWRWREIGADGRICDLIDSQLASIEAACTQTLTIDPRVELGIAFDLLKDRVEQTDGGTTPQPAAAVQEESPAAAEAPAETARSAAVSEAPVAFTEPPQHDAAATEPSFEAEVAPEAAAESPVTLESTALDVVAPESVAFDEPEAAAFDEPASVVAEAADAFTLDAAAQAEDDAVLDAIALEMAAPDPDFDDIIAVAETELAVQAPAEPVVAEPPAPVASQAATAAVVDESTADAPIAMESLARLTDAIAEAAAEVMEQPAPSIAASAMFAAPQATSLPIPSPIHEASLGATILASGMLQKTPTAANDPLAPIRRMTQAEKIAFFS